MPLRVGKIGLVEGTICTTTKGIRQVQLSHTLGSVSAVFDEPNLVSSAGLVSGLAGGIVRQKDDERKDESRRQRKEEHDARMPELLSNQEVLHTPVGADPEWDVRVAGWLNAVRAKVRQRYE